MIAARAVGIKVDMVAVAVATTIVGSGQFPPPVDRRVRGQLSKDIHHHGGYQGRSHCLGFSVNVLTDDAPAVFLQGGPRPHRSHPEAGADLAASWGNPVSAQQPLAPSTTLARQDASSDSEMVDALSTLSRSTRDRPTPCG